MRDKPTNYPNGIEVGENDIGLKGDVEKPVVGDADNTSLATLAADIDELRDALVTLGLISSS